MPRFLRIFNHMIYVPSLSSVSVETSCWGGLSLCLNFHSQKTEKIYFKNWDECQATLKKVKDAMVEIDIALGSIPLVEDPPQPAVVVPLVVEPAAVVLAEEATQPPGGE